MLQRTTPAILWVCLAAAVGLVASGSLAAEYSALWGHGGEEWTPQSRLPDFSYAGYHCGEQPIPTVPPSVSVKRYGAKGDGTTDDTEAFRPLPDIQPSRHCPGRHRLQHLLQHDFLEITGSIRSFLTHGTTSYSQGSGYGLPNTQPYDCRVVPFSLQLDLADLTSCTTANLKHPTSNPSNRSQFTQRFSGRAG